MTQSRNIYLLDPKKLSPETIAVAFAKTSRSPLSFQEIADELSDEKSADFHEKWVVGYGHSSVAEHAVLHIAIENVSRLAIECIESNRLASYTEKSSRYQIWDKEQFHLPDEFIGCSYEEDYFSTVEMLFEHYQQSVKTIRDYLKNNSPKKDEESDRVIENRIHTQTADVCRYYLPASSLANVGVSINARALEHALQKMLSHPLTEVRNIGKEIKAVAQENIPTLVKYADKNAYLSSFSNSLDSSLENFDENTIGDTSNWLNCFACDPDGEDRVLAALLYRFSSKTFGEILARIHDLSLKEQKNLADKLLGDLSEHDNPLRELEYAAVAFDLIIDQGAYFELKRHRMMTQTPQALTTSLGFAVPKLFADAGIHTQFIEDMRIVSRLVQKIALDFPDAASYLVPNAFNRRVLCQMNLRSAYHLIHLRTAPNAHFSIRRPVQRIAEEIQQIFPILAQYFSPKTDETWRDISSNMFLDTACS